MEFCCKACFFFVWFEMKGWPCWSSGREWRSILMACLRTGTLMMMSPVAGQVFDVLMGKWRPCKFALFSVIYSYC